MNFKKKNLFLTALLATFFIGSAFTPPDEGMYPLSELKRVNTQKAGFNIPMEAIYNPKGISLVDALVNVGGCTGSFVSEQGLIITNHHCAFSAVQEASTPEHDYLNKGFVARTREQEIPARGLTCRITESYDDVSDKVLKAASLATDPSSRIRIVKAEMRRLASEAEAQDTTIKAEVSEMFIGKTYILFRYKIIQDVRLVYVPNRQVGEFGGETDNWVWPRHTGDFSFMRAYVSPSGASAKYSKENVPFTPKKFLKVNAGGVNENDFVFILGYPGRTYRNRPYQYLAYQNTYLLPYVSKLYEFENTKMEEAGRKDKATEIKLATRIKRNANVLKNYKGKLKGLNAIDLISAKKAEDGELAAFINNSSDLKAKYGSLMSDIDDLYARINGDAYRDMWQTQIYTSTSLLNIARHFRNFRTTLSAKNEEQRKRYFADSAQVLMRTLRSLYDSYDFSADKAIFKKMLTDASMLPQNQRIAAVDKKVTKGFNNQEQIDRFTESVLTYTKLKDSAYVFKSLLKNPAASLSYNDPLLLFEADLSNDIAKQKAENDQRDGLLNRLMGDYITVKELFKKSDFMPDANSTLRLTYGRIKGYSPADASYMKPFSTVKGIFEKGATGIEDFSYPPAIKELWTAKDFGPFEKKDLGDVPVAFLYDMDTTGGNSGSPVMNANGELIGVNFDRVYEATINDYAWNESYSRSIGVDIRYVLWIASKMDHADFLVTEMGVKL